MRCLLFGIIGLFVSSCGIVAERWIARETVHYGGRNPIPPLHRSSPSILHSVTFFIQLNNLDQLEQILSDISTPNSPNYGKHWTKEQIAAFTSHQESSRRVESYLQRHRITILNKTPHGEYVTGTGAIEDWERLFKTQFYAFQHEDWQGEILHRAMEYSLSEEIAADIQGVFNVVDFPVKILNLKPVLVPVRTKGRKLTVTNLTPGSVNPKFLLEHYGINPSLGNTLTSQGAIECADQYLSSTDLSYFQEEFEIPAQTVGTVYGGHVVPNACSKYGLDNCGEANLDFQYLTAVGQNIPTVSIYVNNSCDWVSMVQFMQGLSNPPKVLSISYASYESSISSTARSAFNTAAIQLGIMGVSLFAASGDDGVVGYDVTETFLCNLYGYGPYFPVTSPYVTAVGATQGPESGNPEVACECDKGGEITSGGGFSLYEAVPSWQTTVVNNYFTTVAGEGKSPKSGYGSGRGYPDISALGYSYLIFMSKNLYQIAGTSCSSPVVAGTFALINSARVAKGLSTMGFLNPFLYQNYPSFVNDITSGANFCTKTSGVCCSQGFYASQGWDPVTGLGVFNFTALYASAVSKDFASSATPTEVPLILPTVSSSSAPSRSPTCSPSTAPSATPSKVPTTLPIVVPSCAPSRSPTWSLSAAPSITPNEAPTTLPTVVPSCVPSRSPTWSLSAAPSITPNEAPTSHHPTISSSAKPIILPSMIPTTSPLLSVSLQIVQELNGINLNTFTSQESSIIQTIEQVYESYLTGVKDYNFQSFSASAGVSSMVKASSSPPPPSPPQMMIRKRAENSQIRLQSSTFITIKFILIILSNQTISYYRNLFTSAVMGGDFTISLQFTAGNNGVNVLSTASSNGVTINPASNNNNNNNNNGSSTSTTSSSSSKNGISIGQVAVIVAIGGFIFVICAIICFCYFWEKYQNALNHRNGDEEPAAVAVRYIPTFGEIPVQVQVELPPSTSMTAEVEVQLLEGTPNESFRYGNNHDDENENDDVQPHPIPIVATSCKEICILPVPMNTDYSDEFRI